MEFVMKSPRWIFIEKERPWATYVSHRNCVFYSSAVAGVYVCVCNKDYYYYYYLLCLWDREQLRLLAEMIDASLSAAELKVRQKRQEELARMRW